DPVARADDRRRAVGTRRQGHGDGRAGARRQAAQRSCRRQRGITMSSVASTTSASRPGRDAASRSPGRLARRFAELRGRNEAAFIPFLMAGDRGLDTTARLLDALVDAGADVIELGVPFSDPMADGPIHQRAAERALRAGTTLRGVLDLVADFRKRSD